MSLKIILVYRPAGDKKVWFAPGLGNTFQVKFGDILYLRSDVVYALGTPMTEDADGERKHYHLQYYKV